MHHGMKDKAWAPKLDSAHVNAGPSNYQLCNIGTVLNLFVPQFSQLRNGYNIKLSSGTKDLLHRKMHKSVALQASVNKH